MLSLQYFHNKFKVTIVTGSSLHITEIVFLSTDNNLPLRVYCKGVVKIL